LNSIAAVDVAENVHGHLEKNQSTKSVEILSNIGRSLAIVPSIYACLKSSSGSHAIDSIRNIVERQDVRPTISK
jgi:hypothetical protein